MYFVFNFPSVNMSQREYPCAYPGCKSVYTRQYEADEHYKTQHENLRYICGVCDREYENRGGLNKHLKSYPDHKTAPRLAQPMAPEAVNVTTDITPTVATNPIATSPPSLIQSATKPSTSAQQTNGATDVRRHAIVTTDSTPTAARSSVPASAIGQNPIANTAIDTAASAIGAPVVPRSAIVASDDTTTVATNPITTSPPSSIQSAPKRSAQQRNKSKGGKGLGKGGTRRHRKALRDNIQGITNSSIRRLARRGGVNRINGLIYEETRGILKGFLEKLISDAARYTELAHRKTITSMDVVYALKLNGHTLYGFGG